MSCQNKIGIKIRTDNIPYLDQYALINKLKIATHPYFNDKATIQIIEKEMKNRKKDGIWDFDN